MKILQVCLDSYGRTGGVSVHVRQISERLAKNHDVTVYAPNYKSRYPRGEVDNGVKVERFTCVAPNNSYFFSWEMLLRLRQAEFDVVHGHGYHAFPLHFAAIAKCTKFVATPHFHGVGHTPFRATLVRLLKPFGERTLKKADKIIAVSEYEKALLMKHFSLDSEGITVIPNGIDYSEFSGLRKKKHDSHVILYVGALFDYKGVQYLVETLPRLAHNVELEIVGSGPLRSYLEKRAHELGVHDRVSFHNNLPRNELLQKYAEADVFALLSQHEAYSIVVAEALAARTPCVVARASALTEWDDGETCLGVEFPINLKELAEKITSILDSNRKTRAFDKWFGHKILDWDQVAEKLKRIYVN